MQSRQAEKQSGDAFFQSSMRHNHCFGCGEDNPAGLGVRSSWDPDDPSAAICNFTPAAHHSAYPPDAVNGGVIASVIDCHAICTAMADAYRRAGREIGDDGEVILYATGTLQVKYMAPTRLHGTLLARARIIEVDDRRTKLEVTVADSSGQVTAEGTVTAVRVPGAWANSSGIFKD
ncbi:MAG: PaaI family thioesterase [Chloroflexi bacterium]|nr:PaaI family thioesterase [Chloroflexota bacterium]